MPTEISANKPARSLWGIVLRVVAFGLAAALMAVGAAGWWLHSNVLADLPTDLSSYRTWRPLTTVVVVDSTGEALDEFYVERRYWVDLDSLPDPVWQAFVAAEDGRFFEHPGVDLQGVARALVANWEAGRTVQGGSTITQQLVKKLLVGDERRYQRKAREAVLAYRLDRELGKEAVLELYLNYVYLGSGNHGVEAAARDYFGKSASELDAGEAALLAGLVPAPSRYNPRTAPELARWRRGLVLRRMVEEGYLPPDEAAILVERPIEPAARSETEVAGVASAYRTEVRRELRRAIGHEVAFQEGFRVVAAMDPALQAAAVEAAAMAVEAHGQRQPEHPGAQAAVVVVDNGTGEVVAVAGGASPIPIGGFNRATQARRQPGSSFKPYVYAAALQRGRSPLDVVNDAPLSLPAGGGRTWSPKNYGGGFAGPMTLRRALASSSNTVAVRLALEAGPETVASMAADLGVRTPLRTDLTISLGSSEVTPLDQAMAYATIARGGVPIEPVFIRELRDGQGDVVGRAGGPVVVRGRELGQLAGAEGERVLDAGTAYELVDMLREVVRAGTARAAAVPGLDRAGKTGTTNNSVDAWFVGMTPSHTIAVWVGTDGSGSLGDRETGGRAALPAWVRVAEALPNQEGTRFAIPPEATLVPTETGWVGLSRAHLPGLANKSAAGPLPGPPR